LRHLVCLVDKHATASAPALAFDVLAQPSMRTDSGFSAGLAIGLLLLVIVVLVILATVPIGSGSDAKPFINIRF